MTHVACGKAKVEEFASNRRVPLPDGKLGIRFSHCNDPMLIAAPEGLIDPWMRTITLFNRQHPIAWLRYYAWHPQSYYGEGHVNPDTPTGLDRLRFCTFPVSLLWNTSSSRRVRASSRRRRLWRARTRLHLHGQGLRRGGI
jgi:hypothetical protein